MKKQKFRQKNHGQIRLTAEEINKKEKGITKTLLEKYKHRFIFNLETVIDNKFQKRVA